MDHNTRIIISADAAGVKSTTDQLEKLGKVDKQNADQFKKHHEDLKKQHGESIDFNTKLTHSFRELGEGIIAAFAVEKVLEFGTESVKAYAEIQEATSKLKFAIMQVNGESEESFNRLVEQAETASAKISNLYTAKNIMGSQSQLANFGISGRMIEQLTPRILDIAASKNITLAEATEKTILAMNGQTKGLRDIGVSFKDTGSKTENFNKLLEQTTKLEGAADEKSHTLAGRLTEMGNNWEVAKENVGGFLAKGFDVIEFFSNLTLEIDDNGESLAKWQKLINASTESAKAIRESMSSGGMAKTQYEIAKQQGMDGVALVNLLAAAKLEIEKNFTEESSKLKDEQIQKELKVLEADKSTYNFDAKEYDLSKQKKIEILRNEIEARKKMDNDDTLAGEEKKKAALDRLLKMQEQFYKDLEAIRLKDADDTDKFNIELITDETNKKLAAQESAFRKEQEEFKKREEKLSEIIAKGKQDQRIKARIELEKLFKAEELAQQAHDKTMSDINLTAHQKQEDFDIKQRESRLEFDKKQIEYGAKNEEIELKKSLINKTITQDEYNTKLKETQLKALEDKLALENEYGIQDIALQQEIDEKKLEILKSSANKTKELITSIQEVTTTILKSLQESIESSISAIDTQMDRQNKMIDYQKVLAEKGLNNDLAFEERRADELSKKKLEEQKKLRKAKELETFLNSLAAFAEQNPNTAIGKALGVLAASKAVEALYMEEGGIMGQTKQRSAIGLNRFSRRHQSGNDILVHGERGEGVIPVRKMREWGLTNNGMFSNFLRNPFKAIPIPQSQPVFVNNNAELLSELKELKEAVKNKPDFFMNVNELNEWVTREVRNGMATITTHKRKGI